MARKLITAEHYKQILIIISSEKKNLTQLADATGFSNFTIGKMATVLENDGLIKKVFGGNKTFLVLTDEGKKSVEGVQK